MSQSKAKERRSEAKAILDIYKSDLQQLSKKEIGEQYSILVSVYYENLLNKRFVENIGKTESFEKYSEEMAKETTKLTLEEEDKLRLQIEAKDKAETPRKKSAKPELILDKSKMI